MPVMLDPEELADILAFATHVPCNAFMTQPIYGILPHANALEYERL